MSVAEVEAYARSRLAGRYAGIALISGQVVIYRLHGDERIDEDIRVHFPKMPLEFMDAKHSYEQLCQVRDAVWGDKGFWTHQGVNIVSTTVAHDGSFVEIGTPRSGDADRLLSRYGEHLVQVVTMDAAHPLLQ